FAFSFRKYGDMFNFPHITRNGTILSTTGTGSYQWFLEGVAIDGAINQTFTATQNGNYTVEITDANGCKGISSVFIISNLSLNDNSVNKKINIYPNPTTGLVTISNEDNLTIDKIEIVNVLGKTVATKTENTSQVDITSLSNGMYVFKIYSGENVSIKKIIKE
ncbi:MAG TPA: T9SS type A sorting domain-containing protein, partial [Flavobacterium sp.]|nr:T9SS type A sorting domain-containing protein [Flavobacterium sp.]